MPEEKLVIDAKSKSLGRIASAAAASLLGKNSPGFLRHKKEKRIVEVINAGKIKITGAKLMQKTYSRYSGYHSGLHKVKMSAMFSDNPNLVVRKAIWGMLPKNKLRKILIKNLKITD